MHESEPIIHLLYSAHFWGHSATCINDYLLVSWTKTPFIFPSAVHIEPIRLVESLIPRSRPYPLPWGTPSRICFGRYCQHCVYVVITIKVMSLLLWHLSLNQLVLSCFVLYCVVLCCIVLRCLVLYCIALSCVVLYCIVLYCIAFLCVVSIALFSILLYREFTNIKPTKTQDASDAMKMAHYKNYYYY